MDPKVRKRVLRMIPHGLQIVTVRDGRRFHGYTSSWMTQASFEPPLLVLGVRRDSLSRSMIEKERVLCIHFLDSKQRALAKRFFRPADRDEDKFEGLAYRIGEHTGCPILEDALAFAECRVVHVYDGGDHSVVVVEVVDVGVQREGVPLLMSDTPWHYGG